MQKLSSFIIDQYDDTHGQIIRDLHTDLNDIPDFIKAASHPTLTEMSNLQDEKFALVLLGDGSKMRKYATIDKGNTALSVIYLLKQAHFLPKEAVKVAATNLISACKNYGLNVSSDLVKMAETGTSPVSGKSQKPYAKGAKVIQLNFTGKEHAEAQGTMEQLGKYDGAVADVSSRTNLTGVQGTNFMTMPLITDKEKTKTAFELRKTLRYVDITDWDPTEDAAHPRPSMTLLGDKFPVDDYSQIKTASVYFHENWRQFEPKDRREYCVKLASRMAELGMDISEDVERYSSPGYAADVDSHVQSRRSMVHPEFHDALDTLLEKRAQVSPETFAEALNEFDNLSSLKYQWDVDICDPWKSTFGPSLEKLAEDNWSYNEMGTHIDEGDLKELALNGLGVVRKQFGHDVAEEFAKKPKVVFNSLPAPNKLVMARLAMAKHDGTHTG